MSTDKLRNVVSMNALGRAILLLQPSQYIFFLQFDALSGIGPLGAGRFGMTATISSPF